FPGPLQRVLLHPVDFGKELIPGMIIKELALEDAREANTSTRRLDILMSWRVLDIAKEL
ncbi:hypothetical protein HAX54_036945, partial [Datura stramonium]|nr:hypothetical protein [Datura stramonium]